MPTSLTFESLVRHLKTTKEVGALIYIKRSKNGKPLNFKTSGDTATSGKWARGLTSKSFKWVLIYWKSGRAGGKAWLADYAGRTPTPGAHVFRLKCVRGPVHVDVSVTQLTGKLAPENPIYLYPMRPPSEHDATASLVEDIQNIAKSAGTSATEREQSILARLGQGRFRERVLAQWSSRCAVTGCSVKEAIRASHIRPWRTARPHERLDPDNGLPLIAGLDALFDQCLITFTAEGEMLVSERLDEEQQDILGVPMPLRRKPSERQARYLRGHRKRFERRGRLA